MWCDVELLESSFTDTRYQTFEFLGEDFYESCDTKSFMVISYKSQRQTHAAFVGCACRIGAMLH